VRQEQHGRRLRVQPDVADIANHADDLARPPGQAAPKNAAPDGAASGPQPLGQSFRDHDHSRRVGSVLNAEGPASKHGKPDGAEVVGRDTAPSRLHEPAGRCGGGRLLRRHGIPESELPERVGRGGARRFDTSIEEDRVEEIARVHGYDAIPTTLPGGATRLVSPSETRSSEHDARRQLVARDYLEAINYAFVDADLLAKWQLTDGGVALANPLSAELGVMRTRLLPGLAAALARNAARQQSRVRLFEIGKTFAASSDAPVETSRSAAP
jgi:hypothetical protein